MKKKRFLLVMPNYSDFPKLFLKNLEIEGFDTYLITDKVSKFKYKGTESLQNFFIKNILRNKQYKQNLINRHTLEDLNKSLSEIDGELDYILIIRPDNFPIPFVKNLKTRTKKLIAYQWDGLEKYPEVRNYIPLVDKFFCFENTDIENHIYKTTNFYFEIEKPVYKEYNYKHPLLYFVGLDLENRREKINGFIKNISDFNIDLQFFLQEFTPNENKNPKITYIKDRISFTENLNYVKNADLLLDFVDPRQDGLSIRFFEALYYKKKIITDNLVVKNYDFYHPDNIFVLENENYKNIEQFLNTPYFELPDNIVKKYGFSNWIKEIIKD